MRFLAIVLCLLAALPASAAGMEEVAVLDASAFESWYYENPSSITGIGDPHILYADGAYYCFATSAGAGFYVWKSEDLVNFEKQKGFAYKMSRDTFGNAKFWAPEAYEYRERYYLFYSAQLKGTDGLRIGVAVSDEPAGPYLDLSDQPLFDFGYSVIDASLFVDDDGQPYLYYSRDCSENVVNGIHESHIYGAKLKEDLSALDGEAVKLTAPDRAWEYKSGDEWRWNEGPIITKRDGRYWMFYSANYYESKDYSVGMAWSESPLGPFEKYGDGPVLKEVSAGDKVLVSGPGHNSILSIPGGDEEFVVYHTHTSTIAPSGDRQMALDRFGFRADGTPYVNGPTLFPQLRPLSELGLINHLKTASVNGDAQRLIDGDAGISEASREYAYSMEAGDGVTFALSKPEEIEAILIYAQPGQEGTGRVVLDDAREIAFELPGADALPGACVRLHFQKIRASTIRVELDQPGALFEVMALGKGA